jgi:hypothetical protein
MKQPSAATLRMMSNNTASMKAVPERKRERKPERMYNSFLSLKKLHP